MHVFNMHRLCRPACHTCVNMHRLCQPGCRTCVNMYGLCQPGCRTCVNMHRLCQPGAVLASADRASFWKKNRPPEHGEISSKKGHPDRFRAIPDQVPERCFFQGYRLCRPDAQNTEKHVYSIRRIAQNTEQHVYSIRRIAQNTEKHVYSIRRIAQNTVKTQSGTAPWRPATNGAWPPGREETLRNHRKSSWKTLGGIWETSGSISKVSGTGYSVLGIRYKL